MPLQRPPSSRFQPLASDFCFFATQIYQSHALRLSYCIQKTKRTSSKRKTPPKTRQVNLQDLTMKTTYFQAECTFKLPEQRFKRRAFYLARHLLLAFALKNSKILQSWFRIQRIAPVLINRCLRHFPMQCGVFPQIEEIRNQKTYLRQRKHQLKKSVKEHGQIVW